MIYRHEDAAMDADAYYGDFHLSHEKWIQGNARCCKCGEIIRTETCVVFDDDWEMQTAMCEDCETFFKKDVDRSNLDASTKELFFEIMQDLERATPHDEWREG